MEINRPKILFMGTPDFAKAALKALNEAGENIVGVITQPDKPSGRGLKMKMCDVKKYAMENGLTVYQPETLKNGAILPLLELLNPELIVVAAYGKILPKYVLEFPKHGCINIHGSLLPKYRGAAPIQRAVIDGKKETGVTIMQMDSGLDTGDILLRQSVEIPSSATAGDMYEILAELGGEMALKVINMIRNGIVCKIKQDDSLATYASKITDEDELIDWNDSAQNINNRIRGLYPFPTARTFCNGKTVKLGRCHVCNEIELELLQADKEAIAEAKIGTVVFASKGKIIVKCTVGCLCVEQAKLEGGKMLEANDLINGRKISVGMRFEKFEKTENENPNNF